MMLDIYLLVALNSEDYYIGHTCQNQLPVYPIDKTDGLAQYNNNSIAYALEVPLSLTH